MNQNQSSHQLSLVAFDFAFVVPLAVPPWAALLRLVVQFVLRRL
jgi:hypothetical protein